jgi:hypothetical protein
MSNSQWHEDQAEGEKALREWEKKRKHLQVENEDLKARLKAASIVIARQIERGHVANAAARITDLNCAEWMIPDWAQP